jgi:MFS transporter, putative metabolite:H+ symporter
MCAEWSALQALLVFRVMVGFGIAGAHVAYTLFMEFLAPGHRGMWLTCIEGFWTLGSLFLAGMAWLVLPTKLGWRGLVVIAAVPLAFLMGLWPFLKESPHWLLANGHTARAQVCMHALQACCKLQHSRSCAQISLTCICSAMSAIRK